MMHRRHFTSISTKRDLREALEVYIFTQSSIGDNFLEKEDDIDLEAFQELIPKVIPDMYPEEIKALFVSMDTSRDNAIQVGEIFSDMTLQILLNRMNQTVTHPLEGSYHCLPCPPFHPDPKQLEAIEVLKKVFEEVIESHSNPLPAKQSPPPPPKAPGSVGGSLGMFSSVFGGTSKQKQANPQPPPKPVEFIPRPMAPKGAYLHGGCGSGKTVLLDLFFRSLPDDITVRRLHWHEFIRDAFRAMQGQSGGENVFVAMADGLAQKFRVLLLDELVITHISEAILVKNLFRHLWARGVTIITTSNYLPQELYSKGFNREEFVPFIPEIEEQMPLINMKGGKDYRTEGVGADESLFLSPINPETSEKLDEMFKEAINGSLETDLEVLIPQENRKVKVPMAGVDGRGANVAKFSFNDLCGKTLGRADYSVLAEHYHTIFVEGVPKFTPDMGAEFRRFVSLTDILYGKKVALVMQSETPVDKIFADAAMDPELDLDELWAFRRCSSMLGEMQSPKYGIIVWLMRNHMLQGSALAL